MRTVIMLIICWIPKGDQLHEVWRIERPAYLDVCLQMNQTMAGGGKAGVITVRCSEPK